MSAGTERPPLARAHTRTTEAKRDEALNEGIRLTMDGETFEVRFGDMTPALERELRRETGMSFFKLLTLCGEDPGSDVLSTLKWLALRIRGEEVGLDDVEVTIGDLITERVDVSSAGEPEVERDGDGNEVVDPQT